MDRVEDHFEIGQHVDVFVKHIDVTPTKTKYALTTNWMATQPSTALSSALIGTTLKGTLWASQCSFMSLMMLLTGRVVSVEATHALLDLNVKRAVRDRYGCSKQRQVFARVELESVRAALRARNCAPQHFPWEMESVLQAGSDVSAVITHHSDHSLSAGLDGGVIDAYLKTLTSKKSKRAKRQRKAGSATKHSLRRRVALANGKEWGIEKSELSLLPEELLYEVVSYLSRKELGRMLNVSGSCMCVVLAMDLPLTLVLP